jgi:hypothetical protein
MPASEFYKPAPHLFKHNSVLVTCKCPRCEVMYERRMKTPSKIVPRIFCELCKAWRHADEAGDTMKNVSLRQGGRRRAANQ